MSPSESDIVELYTEFKPYRDDLRVAGYELVRYALSHARQEANRYRHAPSDYEFGIHKIEFVDPKDLQVYINRHPFYSSAACVPDWAKYHVDKEKQAGAKLLTSWFTDPVRVVLTVVVPPFGLALLGLAAVGDRQAAGQQKKRKSQLPRLSERPKFLQPYRGT
jgi:hypothetical protein